MSGTERDQPRVPKLEGAEGFGIWRTRITFEAKILGFGGHVTGTNLCPPRLVAGPGITRTETSATTPPTTTTVVISPPVSDADVTTRDAEIRQWVNDDDKVLGLIGRYLGNGPLSQVQHLVDANVSAYELIQALVKAYEGTNVGAQTYYAFQQLLRLRYEDGTSMPDHIATVRALLRQLAALKCPVDPQLSAFILLESMPDTPRWELVREPILAAITDSAPLTLEHVEAKISSSAKRKGDETAAAATAKTNKPGSTAGLVGEKWCVVHSAKTHSTEECKKVIALASGKKPRSGKAKPTKANKADDEESGDPSDGDGDEAGHVTISRSLQKNLSSYLHALAAGHGLKSIILDSGASACMTPVRDWFVPKTFRILDQPIKIRFGDHSFVEAYGKGDVIMHGHVGKERYTVHLHDVLFVPDFKLTLISCSKLDKSGYHVSFGGAKCRVLKGTKALLQGTRRGGLYELDVQPEEFPSTARITTHTKPKEARAHAADSKGETVDINLMHRRLGHLNFRSLKRMVAQKQLGNVTHLSGQQQFCEACVLGKMKKLPFPSGRSRATRPLEIVHSDVGGPVTPQSRDGFLFWVTFIDDYTGRLWVYFMKKKSEVINMFEKWKTHAEAALADSIGSVVLSSNYLAFFRSDGGGEYTSKEFEAKLSALGVVHQTTAPDTPEQNGVSERMNQTVVNTATTMLADSKLPQSFWADAMDCAAHLINRRPASANDGRTPYEMWHGRPPDARTLHPFGCTAYSLIQKEKRAGKFQWKARKCILLGYTAGKKDYRLYDIARRTVISSRHVLFDDNDRVGIGGKAPEQTLTEEQWEHLLRGDHRNFEDVPEAAEPRSAPFPMPGGDDDIEPVGAAPQPAPQVEHGPVQPPDEELPPVHDPPMEPAPPGDEPRGETPPPRVPPMFPPPPPRKSQREHKPADRNAKYLEEVRKHQERLEEGRARRNLAQQFRDAQTALTDLGFDLPEEEFFAGLGTSGPPRERDPRSMREARKSQHAEQWEAALNDELEAFRVNDVVEEVPLPQHAKPLRTKIVANTKYTRDGNLDRHKIRIVVQGNLQKEGVDYDETFAPVANLDSIRTLMALAAKYDLELDQMDVSTAYLNGILEEEIYVLPPEGVEIREGYCWRLKRSVYGLKQAGRTWNKTLDKALVGLGFTRMGSETCLYVFRDGDKVCFLVVYVDDLLLAASDRPFMDAIKKKLAATYKMRDMGAASYILGIAITRDRARRTIELSQERYIEKVLANCGMDRSRPVDTPMHHSVRIGVDDPRDNTVYREYCFGENITVSYASVVGYLMYAMLGTRPDIAYAVGVLGRYAANPKLIHWDAAKRVLRYLRGTSSVVLTYDGSDVNQDMDFQGFTDADWSGDVDTSKSTSGYVFITNHGAISWSSKRQKMVALSTTESEYIGLSLAGQHLAWLRSFFEEIGHAQTKPTDLWCDNQAAIILTKDPQFRARTKHIARKYHFVRDDLVASGEASVRYVSTHDQVADIMTKALSKDKHLKFMRAMGLRAGTSGSVKDSVF